MANQWEEITWGDVVELKYGKAIRGYQEANEAYPVYGTNGQVGTHSEFLSEGPGVILGRKGAYRGVHYSKTPFFVIDTAYFAVPKLKLDMRWLYYAMYYYKLGQIDDGSPIPSTTRAAVYTSEFKRPPIEEQRSIAATLGSLDDKVELNRRMNETLEAIARAVFRDWFVDFGPTRRQMEGATDPAAIMGHAFPPEKAATLAPLFPAKLGEDGLPEGWEEQEVGGLCPVVGGGTPSTKEPAFWGDGTHNWATPKDLSRLSGLFLRETERQVTDAGLAKVSSGLSPIGSVLLSSRAPIGYVAIAEEPVAVNQGFIVMQPSSDFPTEFAYFWILENLNLIKANANGSTFQEISKKNFRPLRVNHAGEELISSFSAFSVPLLDLIRSNEQENQTLAEMRDLLLPRLMSGEIRLKNAEVVPFSEVGQPASDFATDLLGERVLTPEQEDERDAVIVAATVKALQKDDLLVGNVRVMKGIYLVKRKQSFSVAKFERQAAGPYDRALNQAIKDYARERSWIREATTSSARGERIRGNRPASKYSEVEPLIVHYDLGDGLNWLSEHFKGTSGEWMECVATVDVAVQELNRKGLDVTVEAIKSDIASDPAWKPKLSKSHFSDLEIRRAVKTLGTIF